jgi:hypothetical protein
MVVVYSLISLLVLTPVSLELGKRRAAAAEVTAETDADLTPA